MNQPTTHPLKKYRLTAFVDPVLVKRAKVRGALEGLTISEVVEKALEVYAPQLERDANQHIHLKFVHGPSLDTVIPPAKHTKNLVVPR